MKKLFFMTIVLIFALSSMSILAGSKKLGDRCIGNAQCGFKMKCHSGVCIAKKAFSKGNKRKVGKACRINADCIGAGKCARGVTGKKVCTGRL